MKYFQVKLKKLKFLWVNNHCYINDLLLENFRRAIGLKIKETKEVWEGEVTELKTEEKEDPHGGYGKIVTSVIVTLKTSKGTK